MEPKTHLPCQSPPALCQKLRSMLACWPSRTSSIRSSTRRSVRLYWHSLLFVAVESRPHTQPGVHIGSTDEVCVLNFSCILCSRAAMHGMLLVADDRLIEPAQAAKLSTEAVARLDSFNRRTMDGLAARIYFYYAWSYECIDQLASVQRWGIWLFCLGISRPLSSEETAGHAPLVPQPAITCRQLAAECQDDL